jgi:succinate dehydrogenase / fumarate reductase cytochrome b subunit
MALSGIFFNAVLSTAFFINITSVFSPDTFNLLSHFMGNNFSSICHPANFNCRCYFSLYNGFVLDYKNRKARPIAYVKNNGGIHLGFQEI